VNLARFKISKVVAPELTMNELEVKKLAESVPKRYRIVALPMTEKNPTNRE
jgi:predicted secreted protein